jgi:diaminopropionate ammonia-lyase
MEPPGHAHKTAEILALLRSIADAFAPTPLNDLPRLAARLGVTQLRLKDEGQRALGSFKSLGGTYAGLLALARHTGMALRELLQTPQNGPLTALVCASDGNHGLAVAAAARLTGVPCFVFLPSSVPAARAARIAAQGAEIVRVVGTYDDAVDQAAARARLGDALLIADTSADPHDPVVGDVMAGYGVMADEIRATIGDGPRPTHLFVQAGVGGLAAAMADGLGDWLAPPAKIIVVEPDQAACVFAGLTQRRAVRIAGTLDTAAEMLSCGEASASALAILLRRRAIGLLVAESELYTAVDLLRAGGGPATTPSGAAGFAGAIKAIQSSSLRARFALSDTSCVLVLATERALDPTHDRGHRNVLVS